MTFIRLTLALCLALFACVSLAQPDLLINADQNAADAMCSITHDEVQTSDPPVFVPAQSGFLSLDTLTLTVTFTRRYYLAHFNMTGANSDVCNSYFQVVNTLETDCTVTVQAAIPWSVAREHCGVNLAETTTSFLYFRGEVEVDLTEKNLPIIRTRDLTRLVHSVFPFVIRFPRTVSTSTTIDVYSPVLLEAAIIRQFDVRTPAETTTAHSSIRLFTSIQSPFLLTLPTWISSDRTDFTILPVTAATDALLPNEDCRNEASDAICEQEWLIEFDASSSPPVCDFTGNYALNFTVNCQAFLGNNCPLPFVADTNSYQALSTVTFHITTEDFCPKTFSDIPLTATIASFQDAALTIGKSDFLQGDTVYFKVNVDSVSASIASSSIDTISIDYGSSPVTHTLLYPPASADLVVHNNDINAKQCEFSVVLNNNFPVPVDGSVPFTFVVVVNVVFSNTQQSIHITQLSLRSVGISSRDAKLLANAGSSGRPIDTSVSVSVGGVAAPSSSSSISTATLIYIIAGSCIGVILFSTIAVIIRRRGIASKKQQQTVASTEMAGASSAVTGATTVV